MELPIAIVAILGAVLIGAISPGPSFVLVARTAVAVSRSDGVATALGMGLGGLIFAAAALLGLQVVLAAVPSLYLGLKIAGAAYLIYLAVQLWRGAAAPIAAADVAPFRLSSRWIFRARPGDATEQSQDRRGVRQHLHRPAAGGSPRLVGGTRAAFDLCDRGRMVCDRGGGVSSERPRRGYLRSKRWIDRTAGAIMGLLAVKLIWEAR